jgi:DNA polymerase-3 subunit alpha
MDDSHGSSTQEPELVQALPWGVKERLTHEKTAVGFYLSGHLFDEVATEVRRFAKRAIDDLIDSREPQLLAGIVGDFRVINGQRGKLGLFKLDDKSGVIDARVDEALMNANKHLFKDDELVIVMGKVMPDRFSGGLQLNVNQVWDLAAARCRFGKYLKVKLGTQAIDIRRLISEFPPLKELTEQGELLRGLGVRLQLERHASAGSVAPGGEELAGEGHALGKLDDLAAQAEIALGDQVKFFPSDAALGAWLAHAGADAVNIVYEG